MITVQNLQKHFKLNKQYRGAWGSVRTLFSREYEVVKAVDDISFNVARGELVGYLGAKRSGQIYYD